MKRMIRHDLVDIMGGSRTHDLPRTCSALLDCLQPLPHFHHIVKQLSEPDATTCAKDEAAAREWKLQGNSAFSDGDYPQALRCYTQALRCIPLGLDKIDENMVAALHFNRASVLRKMDMLKESIRDCSRVLKLQPSHSKAWYCKGKANAGLKNYEDAISDMHAALSFEKSSLGKKQIRVELASIIQQFETDKEVQSFQQTNDQDDFDFQNNDLPEVAEVQIVSTMDKGLEIQAKNIVLPGDLVLHEEPYVAVILKTCRDTHCHFCFNKLPGDPMPCELCAIPLYCSENCREHAVGSFSGSKHSKRMPSSQEVSDRSHYEIARLSLSENNMWNILQRDNEYHEWYEHKHECGGMSWAAVLPTEAILATRMLMKSIYEQSVGNSHGLSATMNFCHHYEKMQPQDKLDLHILAVVLAFCLQSSSPGLFQLTGSSISKLALHIAHVKVNAMAIVHVSSPDITVKRGISTQDNMTCPIKQVNVAQAIYPRGSTFNHSCIPNTHASFVSRRLLAYVIQYLPPGSPLELCYGPQLGESGVEDRQKWLKQRYFFVCKCVGCSELNFSDLVLSSYRCVKYDCLGIVLDRAITRLEKMDGTNAISYANVCTQDLIFPADERKQQSIDAVAHLLIIPKNKSTRHFSLGHCLNCGSICDLERNQEIASRSLECLKRVHTEINSNGDKQILLDDAVQSLQSLKSVLHAFNKQIAKAEDIVAEIFCLILKPQFALQHCKESIQILEKLYHNDHIVIANELVKLVSIALALNKYEYAKKNFVRIDSIFSRHYGCNHAKVFPYLRYMKKLSCNILGKS